MHILYIIHTFLLPFIVEIKFEGNNKIEAKGISLRVLEYFKDNILIHFYVKTLDEEYIFMVKNIHSSR